MDMVRHRFHGDDLPTTLQAALCEQIFQAGLHLPDKDTLSILRAPHQVIPERVHRSRVAGIATIHIAEYIATDWIAMQSRC